MNTGLTIELSDGRIIRLGDMVRLGRFDTEIWITCFGWYSWGGNRPVCGWYLQSTDKCSKLKPLQLPDLDDIYLIDHVPRYDEDISE